MATHEQTGRDRDNTDIRSTVEQILLKVGTLPESSDAAKLRGIACRLAAALDGSELIPPLADRFAAAVRDGLDADPWLAVDRLARRLLEACDRGVSERRRNADQEQLRKRRAEQEERWNAGRTEASAADMTTRE